MHMEGKFITAAISTKKCTYEVSPLCVDYIDMDTVSLM